MLVCRALIASRESSRERLLRGEVHPAIECTELAELCPTPPPAECSAFVGSVGLTPTSKPTMDTAPHIRRLREQPFKAASRSVWRLNGRGRKSDYSLSRRSRWGSPTDTGYICSSPLKRSVRTGRIPYRGVGIKEESDCHPLQTRRELACRFMQGRSVDAK